MNSNLERKINNILETLHKHIGKDKNEVLVEKIKIRLNQSLDQYKKDLTDSIEKIVRYYEKYQLTFMKKLLKDEDS